MNITDHDQRGATTVEYATLLAAVTLIIFGAVTLFGAAVAGLFVIPWP